MIGFSPPLLIIVQKLLIPLAMSDVQVIGNVEKSHDEAEFEWKIPEFFSIAENHSNLTLKCPTFFFADTSWYFQMVLGLERRPTFMSLYILQVGNLKCGVKYYFGLKEVDGSIQHLAEGVLTVESGDYLDTRGTKFRFAGYLLFDFSEVQQRKLELAPSDVLTVKCALKCETNFIQQQAKLLKPPKLQKLTNLNLLSENMKHLFSSGEFCDVILRVKDKEFKAHKIILVTRSPVFASYFKHETMEKQTGLIKIPDCDPDSFKEFLEYLYSGKLVNTSLPKVLHLYRTADKYDVQELKMFCVEYMKRNFNVEYFCDVFVLAEVYNDGNLFGVAQEFFNRNFGEIFETDEWKDLMKNRHNLANSILTQMSKCVQVVAKRPRLE